MYPIVIGNYVEVLLLDSPKLLTITTNNLFIYDSSIYRGPFKNNFRTGITHSCIKGIRNNLEIRKFSKRNRNRLQQKKLRNLKLNKIDILHMIC
jgi:hypothetical protein